MVKNKIGLLLLVLVLIIASGCSSNQTIQQTKGEGQNNSGKTILYENVDAGIRVFEADQWVFGKESSRGTLNVTFESNKLKAIVTTVPKGKTIEEIKSELKTGAGNVIIIEEKEDYLSFKSERKESIRTDVYIKKAGVRTGIIIFMTPTDKYEKNQDIIIEFKKSVEFF